MKKPHVIWPRKPGDLFFRRVPEQVPPYVCDSVRAWRLIGGVYSGVLLVVALWLMAAFIRLIQGKPPPLPPLARSLPKLWGMYVLLLGALEWLPVFAIRRAVRRAARDAWKCDHLLCLWCGYVLLGLPTEGACPECGEIYDVDRVRQSWRMWSGFGSAEDGNRQTSSTAPHGPEAG